jgi:hypothetical protein
VKAVPFFKGTISVTVPGAPTTSDFDFYAGLNRIVVDGCDLGPYCPPESQSWDSVSCSQYFTNCDECKDASVGSVTMVVMSFVTQLPQITSDIGRSMGTLAHRSIAYFSPLILSSPFFPLLPCSQVRYALPEDVSTAALVRRLSLSHPNTFLLRFPRRMGIVTGVLGLLSTLAALNSFADTCFRNLDSNSSFISIDKEPGTAFILLLVATILKVVDIWAHVIVPVPEGEYWTPDYDEHGGVDSNSKTQKLIDPTAARSNAPSNV